MKKPILTFILFSTLLTSAQYNKNAPWMEGLDKKQSSSVSKSTNTPFTIYEISDSFDAYWKDRNPNKKGSGYKPFMRWENRWKELAYSNGKLPTSGDLWNSWKKKRDRINKAVNPISGWSSIGPFSTGTLSGSLPGQGRVNAVAVDPNDENTWYVGAPAGGLWKSTNTGTTWASLFDDFPQIGVSGIAIDPKNSNIIYVATGDDDAADSYSVGVFKSLDGGTTWNETGLNPANSTINSLMNEIVVDPVNSDIVWVGTSDGLQKSEDGGDTWTIKRIGNVTDFKLKPQDSQTVYAVTNSLYYKSTDGGDTFVQINSNLPAQSGRLVLGVSPADPEILYLLSANTGQNDFAYQGLFKSTDSGESFIETSNSVDIFESSQAWFDLAIEISPTNADEVYIGCLNIWKSVDGGNDFTKLNEWFLNTPSYTHADIHTLKFFNDQLFCGSDGGIYVSEDNGNSFVDHTEGIAISQFYRLSVAKNNASKMVGGLQDNAGFVRNNGDWNVYTGGDGMDYEVDPSNDNIVYGFTQFGGNLFISTDTGQSVGAIQGPAAGNWITPLTVNSIGEVYAGYNAVYKLIGNTLEKISDDIGTGNIDDLEVDLTNPLIMYAVEGEFIYRSEDGGVTFTELSEFESDISDIAVNENIIYVTTSNRVGVPQSFQQELRGVFKLTINETDVSVESISFNLPTDQAYLSIVHQGRHSENPIYVGTNLGVYRLDDTLTEWEDYFTNLPNTAVSDLEISLEDELISASTYGRGVWQSAIPVQVPDNDVRLVSITPQEGEVFCGDLVLPEITIENKGTNQITEVNITYDITGGTTENFTWTGDLAPAQTTVISLPAIALNVLGKVTLNASLSIANDAFDDNNAIRLNFIKNEFEATTTVFAFETEDNALISFNDGSEGSVWERGVPTGNLLNETSSGTQVFGTVLNGNHPDNTQGILLSRCYDLSSMLAPTLKFNMGFDLEINFDIVYVQYSINSGATWNVLGNLNSQPNWYNSDRTNENSGAANDCQNCPGAQWTGTDTALTEYAYDFAINAANSEEDLTNETNVLFRIVFQSDPNLNQEGVIIDDFVVIGLEDDDDDDNDGILDVNDNCPLIANADQLDTDDDNEGNTCDTDDDNDGIADVDDNCPLTPNADQADFDGDGIGDVCDEDIDNDGLANTADTCPETLLDVPIDVSGCEVFSLATANFSVLTKGTGCIGSNNGSIEIQAIEAFSYTAILTGGNESISNPFTEMISFTDLEAGNYKVCITIAEAPDYENCFNLTITEPESLSVSSKVSSLKSEITIDLTGGEKYFINLNNEIFVTSESQITLPLKRVENQLSIQTDTPCQGEYIQTVFLSDEVLIYPNPIESGDLNLYLGNMSQKEVRLSLYNITGKATVFEKKFSVNDNRVKFNIDALSKGIYILNLRADDVLLTYKIVRK